MKNFRSAEDYWLRLAYLTYIRFLERQGNPIIEGESMNYDIVESGKLHFTVDYPALYTELVENNLDNIGPGVAMGLRIVLLGLKRIAELAIRDDQKEMIAVLADLGIVEEGVS